MKPLQELVNLITRYKRRQIEILGQTEDSSNKYEIFYDRVEKGKFADDDEAAAFFYGPDKDGSHTQYQNFKSAFFKRLVNTFFFIDLKKPAFNDAQSARFNCWKNMAAMRMMMARGAKYAAHRVAMQTLRPALKYEVTEVVLEISRFLLYFYTVIKPDRKKQQEFLCLIKKSQADLNATVKAETMYYELIAPQVSSKSSMPWISERAKECLQEIKPFFQEDSPFKFRMFYFLIKRIERESIHDYEGTVKVCKEALKHFERKKSTPKSTFALFYNTLLISLTVLRNFEEAGEIAEKGASVVSHGNFNWYKNRELYLVLLLHKKDYQTAFEVFQNSVKLKQIKALPIAEQETWNIYQAYLSMLIGAGKITLPQKEKDSWKLRPAKLLNQFPTYSKDKRGMNIPILTIHTILLFQLNRYDEAYDRILALEKYGSRHLKAGDDTFRSWCFFQALLQIQKAGFCRAEAEKKAADWLSQMSEQNIQYVNAPHEVEAIPYEHLWGLTMEALDLQFSA